MRCDKVEGDASRTAVRRAGAGWGEQQLVESWEGGKEIEADAGSSSSSDLHRRDEREEERRQQKEMQKRRETDPDQQRQVAVSVLLPSVGWRSEKGVAAVARCQAGC
jgi:hypothetical protein